MGKIKSLAQIDGRLKNVSYYAVGVNNIIYNVDNSMQNRDETETTTMGTGDVIRMIDSTLNAQVQANMNGMSSLPASVKSYQSNPEPPRPPKLALDESAETIAKRKFNPRLSAKVQPKVSLYQSIVI